MTDVLENKIHALEYKVGLLEQSVEQFKRRAGEFMAERDKLREAMMRACDLIDDVADGKTGMGTPYRVLAAALQETEK